MKKANNSPLVRVVGAGIGGLSAAIFLARAGCRVQVFEKQATAGGKAAQYLATTQEGLFRWDIGPSLLTMPHILGETLKAAGLELETACPLVRVVPSCRYFWQNGHILDEDEAFWSRPDVQRYLRRAKGIYELSSTVFLRLRPSQWWRAVFNWKTLRNVHHLLKITTLETLHDLNRRFFKDDQIVQLFDRFATYTGSSPYRTPSLYAIIPYIEYAFGAWIPKEGMYRVVTVLEEAARSLGVELYYNTEVRDLLSTEAAATVCNADLLSAVSWLPRNCKLARRLHRKPLSCSGYVMLLAVRGQRPALLHHNVLFSKNYQNEFVEIFEKQIPPTDPTIYICISCRHVTTDAPNGYENWFILVNMPAEPEADLSNYGDFVIERIREFGIRIQERDIIHRHEFGPREIALRDNAWRGALYGWASHGKMNSVLRPPIRHPIYKDLFFCGGTTHPGGGIPLVLLSGRIAAEYVLECLNHSKKLLL